MSELEVRKWIRSDPAIMKGKPVIARTRITVELILEKLAGREPQLRKQPRGEPGYYGRGC